MRFVATSFLLISTALPLAAEITGELRLGQSEAGALSGAAVFADATWRYEFGRIGVSLGAYGVWTSNDQPHETYAALSYRLDNGLLSLGVPRPAYDLFAVSVIDHALPALGLSNVAQTRSHATALATAGGGIPVGLGLVSDRLAGSILYIGDTNTTVASIGSRFGKAPVFEGALEVVDGPGGIDANAKLGVVHQIDATKLGATLFHNETLGQALELSARFPVGNNVQIDLFAQIPDDGIDGALTGAAAEFPLGAYSFVNTALARDANGAGAYAASIGWRF